MKGTYSSDSSIVDMGVSRDSRTVSMGLYTTILILGLPTKGLLIPYIIRVAISFSIRFLLGILYVWTPP